MAPRTAETVGVPPTSKVDATPLPTANAAATPPEAGPNRRPPLLIVDAATTSAAGAAAAPARVSPIWREGPCLHPEPEPAPLPPSPLALPPAGKTGRKDNARDPLPAAATLSPPSSLRAGGDGEYAEDAGASCRNLHGDQLHLPVRAKIRQPWGRLKLAFPWTRATQRGEVGLPLGGPVCAGTDAAEYEKENLLPVAAKIESAYKGGHG